MVIDPEEKLITGVPEPLKLHLACGQQKREGYVGVDIVKTATTDVVADLMAFPLPWKDGEVSEIICEHFLEHIPNCNYGEITRFEPNGNLSYNNSEFNGKDFLIVFMNECYRILKPDGVMKVVVPAAPGERAFQDPTHRRFLPRTFWAYLDAKWRKDQKLDHMDFACDFDGVITPMIDPEWSHRAPEIQQFAISHYVNVLYDFSVTLTAKKPMRTGGK
ncbi:class I SAM-dependent methyltransferase [Glutamicibacter sp.]|jgi:Uncharacterized protein conserved in bacteria|uniref:class I SAM-dependent methyltransferase n=1 Tax=Glutamicibacter sp. TaxID=1931995 RepID=UPI002FD9AF0D